MLDMINLPLIMLAGLIAAGSPGPATLALASTSMEHGRKRGLALASGISTGSFIWSVMAALGLGTLMKTNVWAFEMMRYFGAGYLLWLAFKSARSALSASPAPKKLKAQTGGIKSAYLHGLALHLTNPKAILFFASLFAVGIPASAPASSLMLVIAVIGIQSALIFHGYALLFSYGAVVAGYNKLRRWFEVIFACAFGAAGIKILTARFE
ncbi:MAG: amino acid transporter [Hyphomicrobiales bacterium]|nr:MAG: amino acid transporter [Hyphomicrobiales bacterium]